MSVGQKVGIGESRYHSWGCHEVLMPNFMQFNKRKWRSDEFEVAGYRWRFLVFPKSDVTGKKDQYLSIFVGAADAMDLPPDACPKAQIWLSVINHADPIKTKMKETSHVFSKEVPSWGFSQFMPYKEVLEGWLTPGGSLHLRMFIKTECKRKVKITRPKKQSAARQAELDRCGSTKEVSSIDTAVREEIAIQDVGGIRGSGSMRFDPVMMIQAEEQDGGEIVGEEEQTVVIKPHQKSQDMDDEVDSKVSLQEKKATYEDDEDGVQQGGVDRKELCVNDDEVQQTLDTQTTKAQSLEQQASGNINSGVETGGRNTSGGLEDSRDNRNSMNGGSSSKTAAAEKKAQSTAVVAQYSLAFECNISELKNIKQQMNSTVKDAQISEIHLIIKAAAMTLKQVPIMNCGDGEHSGESSNRHIFYIEHQLDGRMQRRLGKLDKKGIPAIAALLHTHSSSKASELESNIPSFALMDMRQCGLKECTALLGSQHNAILCVGTAHKKVQSNNNKDAFIINFSLTCDQRKVDKNNAAKWLEVFQGHIEQPMSMLI